MRRTVAIATIKYDYSNVDESQGQYDGDEPTRGIYQAKVTSVEQEQSSKTGNPMLHAKFEITAGDFKGWIGHDYYVLTEEAAWKLKQFTDALGITSPGKQKGQFKTETAVGKKCRIKVIREMYEGEPRGKVRSVLSFKGEDDEGGDDAAPADDETPQPDEPDADGGSGDADVWTWEDLSGLDRDGLKQVVKDEELDPKELGLSKDMSDDDVRKKIAEALEVEVPADDAGADEDPF